MKKLLLAILFSATLAFGQSSTGNITAAGSTCATTNACIRLNLPVTPGQLASTAGLVISGTFSGTFQFEVSADNVNYAAVLASPVGSGSAVSSTTGVGTWTVPVAGMLQVRVRCSAYTSGTAVVTLTAGASGANGGVTGSGAINTIPIFTASSALGNSPLTVSGSALNVLGLRYAGSYFADSMGNGTSTGIASSISAAGSSTPALVTVPGNYPTTEAVPGQGEGTNGNVSSSPTPTTPSNVTVADYRYGYYLTAINPFGNSAYGANEQNFVNWNANYYMPDGQSGGVNRILHNEAQYAFDGGVNTYGLASGYKKTNWNVLRATHLGFTPGQHIASWNSSQCFSLGDCLAAFDTTTFYGGFNAAGDEAATIHDMNATEGTVETGGTGITAGTGSGSQALTVTFGTGSAGTQGAGRFFIDSNSAYEYTGIATTITGTPPTITLSSLTPGASAPACNSGNVSVTTATTANEAVGVTVIPVTSGTGTNFSAGVAGIFDSYNFEFVTIASVAANSITLAAPGLTKQQSSGATVSQGGLVGYGEELAADEVFSSVAVSNASWLSSVATYTSAATVGVGQAVVVSGVNPSGYNQTCVITATGAGTFNCALTSNPGSFVSAGTVGTPSAAGYTITGTLRWLWPIQSSTASCATITPWVDAQGAYQSYYGNASTSTAGTINVWPMAEVTSVEKSAAGADTGYLPGVFTLSPNAIVTASGDTWEMPHYPALRAIIGNWNVTQFLPSPSALWGPRITCFGYCTGGAYGLFVTNSGPSSSYVSGGGAIPSGPTLLEGQGVFGQGIHFVTAPDGATIYENCPNSVDGTCAAAPGTKVEWQAQNQAGTFDYIRHDMTNEGWIFDTDGGTSNRYELEPSTFTTPAGAIPNADLANASTTVFGTACTLGSSCTPTVPVSDLSSEITTVFGTSCTLGGSSCTPTVPAADISGTLAQARLPAGSVYQFCSSYPGTSDAITTSGWSTSEYFTTTCSLTTAFLQLGGGTRFTIKLTGRNVTGSTASPLFALSVLTYDSGTTAYTTIAQTVPSNITLGTSTTEIWTATIPCLLGNSAGSLILCQGNIDANGAIRELGVNGQVTTVATEAQALTVQETATPVSGQTFYLMTMEVIVNE